MKLPENIFSFIEENECEKVIKNIRSLLKQYIVDNNLKSLVLGVSGGIDSALVAVLVSPVCKELNIPLIGRSITIESNKPDEIARAKAIGENFCDNFKEENLTELYYLNVKFMIDSQGIDESDLRYKIRKGNLKARMRMIHLMDLAHKNSGITLSTDNYSEYQLSFSTLLGDSHSDIAFIQQLWKTEVYSISDYLIKTELSSDNIKSSSLLNCITASATDGLGISETDLDQILPNFRERHSNTRSGYNEVDLILIDYLKNGGNENHDVIKRHINTTFKRNWPVIFTRDQLLS